MNKPLTFFGEPYPRAIEQIENCLRDERAVAGALMADNHVGYAMPIGGVVAYEDAISPTGVGFDIGCGNKAVRTKLSIFDLGIEGDSGPSWVLKADPTVLTPLMREIQKKVAFGLGRNSGANIDHALFEDDRWQPIGEAFGYDLEQKAREQLGTVGSGNHYVDLLVDSSGRIWVACHFGSRGFGHTIASGFMAVAAGKEFTERVPETEDSVVLSTQTDLGQFYIEAMELAGEYAYAGRDYVVDQVLQILGTESDLEVHNHHNYSWLENGKWVVRKGATPLTREPAFIGGSMGDISVIVRGTPNVEDNIAMGNTTTNAVEDLGNLGSAPHGAGRVMSRTKAAGKYKKINVERKAPDGSTYQKRIRVRDKSTAAINWDEVREDLTKRGIVVLGAGADESPGVYKDLAQVLAAHSNIQVMETLRPLGVVMAGSDTFDPYKD